MTALEPGMAIRLRQVCCPVLFVAGTWLLSLQASRNALERAWPTIGSEEQWDMLHDTYVALAFLCGFPPPPRAREPAYDPSPSEMVEDMFRESNARRTRYDIVTGNILLALFFAPLVISVAVLVVATARAFRATVVGPATSWLTKRGLAEPVAYLSSFLLCCLGLRLAPVGQPTSGLAAVVTTGGALLFFPCWQRTVAAHGFARVERLSVQLSPEDANSFRRDVHSRRMLMRTVGCSLQALVLVSFAVTLQSRVVGFVAVGAVFLAACLDFIRAGESKGTFMFQLEALIDNIGKFSLRLAVGIAVARPVGGELAQIWLGPFSVGVCCFGHTVYFLSIVTLASSAWPRPEGADVEQLRQRQLCVAASLAVAAAIGYGLGLEAMQAVATTFALLWLLNKECEVQLTSKGSLKLAMKWASRIIIMYYFLTNFDKVLSMFDPEGLYV